MSSLAEISSPRPRAPRGRSRWLGCCALALMAACSYRSEIGDDRRPDVSVLSPDGGPDASVLSPDGGSMDVDASHGDGGDVPGDACITMRDGGVTVCALSLGYQTTCALLADGTVRCWGENAYGELGNGTVDAVGTSPQAPADFRPAPVVGLGGVVRLLPMTWSLHSCALLADDTVRCWGENSGNQLGDGTTHQDCGAGSPDDCSPTPVRVIGLSARVAQIVAGGLFTCVRLTDGTVQCWGTNNLGQLGDGTMTGHATPGIVAGLSAPVAQLAAGTAHTCALLTNGTVRCWGTNSFGQLGDGTTTDHNMATPVSGLNGVLQLAAAGEQTCALMSGGAVQCWGMAEGAHAPTYTPTTVQGLGGTAVQVTAGNDHACALLDDGTVRCWSDRTSPGIVAGLGGTVVQLVAGGLHTCALVTDGTMRCWGSNFAGELGGGAASSTTMSDPPTTVVW